MVSTWYGPDRAARIVRPPWEGGIWAKTWRKKGIQPGDSVREKHDWQRKQSMKKPWAGTTAREAKEQQKGQYGEQGGDRTGGKSKNLQGSVYTLFVPIFYSPTPTNPPPQLLKPLYIPSGIHTPLSQNILIILPQTLNGFFSFWTIL